MRRAARALSPAGAAGQRVLLAVVSFVPLLLTARGDVGADTKSYLYLDPGRLLESAPHLWDSQVGMGTITHQNIGYLWPMGPFFWLAETAGLPDWVAQRLWMGGVLFAAGLGVQYLLRLLGWRGAPVLVASLAYTLSPYVLHYIARISAILLPWAGLPWLIALTMRSLRVGGWRYPALFALVATTVGGTNATSLLFVGLGPALWIVHELVVEREVGWRTAAAASARIGSLTLVTGLWWIAGLRTQGAYGLPILRYTETYEVVSDAATAPELLRGLGYWFFYGGDKIGPWIESSVRYTEAIWLLVVSFALPCAALLVAGLLRFRHRAYFLTLVVVGVLIGVGSHPYDGPSLLGRLFKEFTRSEAGLALRSTPRALPLAVLGIAVLLGAAVSAVARWRPRLEVPAAVGLSALVLANQPSLFTGEFIGEHIRFPEEIPSYWHEAAADLVAAGSATRVLEVPGSDFSSYRWGNTIDPVTPGLIDRPYVARELIPYGTPASADLVKAVDRGFQEGTYDPDALAELARLMGVGDVVLRADLQYERYRTPRPVLTFLDLLATAGLGEPAGYGERAPNVAGPEQPLLDEIELGTTAQERSSQPAPVEVFPVEDPLPIVRAVPAERPLVVAGSADGLVQAAGMGILDAEQAVLFSASFASDPDGLADALGRGADLLVTDSNKRRASRWGTIRETEGYVERADEEPLVEDPTDNRLAVFPDAGPDAQTVAVQRGASVSATDYGNSTTYTIDDRAVFAVDGDPATAWETGVFENPEGERLVIELPDPVELDRLVLLQPTTGANRWITRATVRLDGDALEVPLGPESRQEPGQVVTFPARTVQRIEVEVAETNVGDLAVYQGFSAVGFAEVVVEPVGGERIVVDEWLRLPVDLLRASEELGGGDADLEHRLGILLSRLRSDPREPVRVDGEPSMQRLVELPSAREFAISGEARISAALPDDVVDRLLGIGGPAVTSSYRLPGDLRSRSRAAFDGDPDTAWQTPFGGQAGHWIRVRHDSPVTVDGIAVELLVDGLHSVPSELRVLADGAEVGTFPVEVGELPAAGAGEPGRTVRVELPVPELEASEVVVEVVSVAETITKDWHTGNPIAMPVGIAEIEGLGVAPAQPSPIDTGCREDVVTVDGRPVPVRIIERDDRDPLARQELVLEGCGSVELGPGEHEISTARGAVTGFDVDALLLASERGGGPLAGGWEVEVPPAPDVEVTSEGRDHVDVELGEADEPYWLVLGQSFSDGWDASDGLGTPTLVNGYANGWLIDPSSDAVDGSVTIRFAPQRLVWIAIWLSAAGVLLTLVLAWRGRRGPAPPVESAGLVEPSFLPARALPLTGRRVAVAAAAAGLFALVNLPSWHVPGALAVAAGVVLASRQGRYRSALGAASAASLAAAALFIVAKQVDQRLPADFAWPQQFERVHVLGVLAVAFLAGEVCLAVAEHRLGRRSPDVPPDEVSPSPDRPRATAR